MIFTLSAAAFVAMIGVGPDVALLDDRGQPLRSGVELCFVHDLETQCRPWEPGAPWPLWPEHWESLKIEGSDYGPLSLRPSDLTAASGLPIRIARKALLQVGGHREGLIRVSLYPISDPELRQPKLRIDLPADGRIKIPAGQWLGSLSSPGRAPDLHRFDAAPGGTVVPRAVLAAHLAQLGVANSTSVGRRALVHLAPGGYEIYSAAEASEETLAAGLPNGFLGRVDLPAGGAADFEVVIAARAP